MTDDLVTRLRELRPRLPALRLADFVVLTDAIDEIERLRADNEMLRGLIDLPPGHHHVHVNKDGTITAVPMQLLTGPLRPRPTITPLWVDAPVLPVETP